MTERADTGNQSRRHSSQHHARFAIHRRAQVGASTPNGCTRAAGPPAGCWTASTHNAPAPWLGSVLSYSFISVLDRSPALLQPMPCALLFHQKYAGQVFLQQ